MTNVPPMNRMIGLLLLLAGCAGDLESDAPGGAVEHGDSGEHALVAIEPVPEVEWRAAPACGEELPANGAVRRVEREAGLRAWVAPDLKVLCVDSRRRFRFTSDQAARAPDWQAMTYTGVGSDAPPDPRAGEPSPQPMNRADADEPKSASAGTSSGR